MKRFLVVDDDTLSLQILLDFLSEFAQCDTAQDGKIAFEMFEESILSEKPYHLICSDIFMPIMDGHELVRLVRLKEKTLSFHGGLRTTIFMITSSDTPKDMACAIWDNDCDDYIVKPFQLDDLMSLLKKYNFIDCNNNP